MFKLNNLVVALPRTEIDLELIAYAAVAAIACSSERVRFIHVLPRRRGEDGTSDHERRERCEAAILAEIAEHFAPAAPSVVHSLHVLEGPLTDRLIAFATAERADGVLVGHRLSRPGRRSLARRLAMSFPGSVWLVPEGSRPHIQRMVVPVDFSSSSEVALRQAIGMVRSAVHPECVALHVYFNEARITYEGYDPIRLGEELRHLEEFVAEIDSDGVPVTPICEEASDVSHAVNRVADAQGADLVVMGTRGRSRSAAILLGTVAEQMIVETRVPLLVIKEPGTALNLLQVLLERAVHPDDQPHP